MNPRFLICIGLVLAAANVAAPAQALNGPFSGTYQASEIVLDRLVGRVEIAVGGSQVSLSITGRADELQAIQVSSVGAQLKIVSTKRHHFIEDPRDYAQFKLTVPQGTNLTIEDMVGEAAVGDIGGDVKIAATSLDATIGAVKSAKLDISGSLDLTLGDVAGKLDVDVSGSADVKAGSVESADLDISGSGELELKTVRRGLTAEINGSGSVKVEAVNGPVRVDLSGSGEVAIAHGRADPLKVDISGDGEFSFGGEAVNPEVEVSGSGSIQLGSYTGKLKSQGGDLTIGH
jgi:hypothetical protein